MKTELMLIRRRAAWKRIARAAAALARSKGHDVQDPEYTSGGGIDHEMMINLETVATALEKLAGIDDQDVEEEAAGDEEKAPPKRARKK